MALFGSASGKAVDEFVKKLAHDISKRYPPAMDKGGSERKISQKRLSTILEESFARAIGLEPAPVDHELRDGALSGAPDHLLGGTGRGFDVNFFVGNFVGGQEAFDRTAIGAPEGGVERNLHQSILTTLDSGDEEGSLTLSQVRGACAR